MNESAPHNESRTRKELLERIGQIDKAIIAAEDGLDRVPADYEESKSGDDNATESQGTQQALGGVSQELEELRREKAELQSLLDSSTS
jgi:hypothetical protein